MDIKEIAEQVSKRIYVEDGLLLSKFISEKFAETLIESYKAELLKEVGEPVAFARKWHIDGEVPRKEKQENGRLAWPFKFKIMPITIGKCLADDAQLYTSDQVAAAIVKATKPLEEEVAVLKETKENIWSALKTVEAQLAAAQEEIERLNGQISVYRLSFVELERQRDVEMASATRWATGYHELRDQLAAAQKENGKLRKDAETYGPEKIAIQKQAWLEADRQRQINDLKDQLAKAEQRVAEACALQVATETKFHWLDAARVAKEIRSGEWRKFVKEV